MFQFNTVSPQQESPSNQEILNIPTAVAYQRFISEPRYNPLTSKYDKRTGEIVGTERIHMQSGNLGVTISEHGATITRLSISGTPVIFSGSFERLETARDSARGNIPNNLPQISHDRSSKKPYPFHGYCQRSLLSFEPSLSKLESGVAVFSITSNEIHPSFNAHEGVVHYIIHKLEPDGSITTAMQTFNFGKEQLDIAPAIHPYWLIESQQPQEIDINLFNRNMFIPSELKHTLFAKMLGDDNKLFQILTARFKRFSIQIIPLLGFSPRDAQYWAWTDSNNYICFEPTSSGRIAFTQNTKMDSQDFIPIKPNTHGIFAVNIKVESVVKSQ